MGLSNLLKDKSAGDDVIQAENVPSGELEKGTVDAHDASGEAGLGRRELPGLGGCLASFPGGAQASEASLRSNLASL